jgi:gliding motility-associated lipoprotein GldH
MAGSNKPVFLFSLLLASTFWFTSCETVDLYEKNVAIPDQAWKSSFKPQFKFTIKDNSVPYNIYIVLRHNEKYNYNNIWLALSTRVPGDTTVQKVQYELPLANSEGWLTNDAMDDLYEHRILITPGSTPFYFKKTGEYIFKIEQIMREDPLQNILNVGLRLEKKQQ